MRLLSRRGRGIPEGATGVVVEEIVSEEVAAVSAELDVEYLERSHADRLMLAPPKLEHQHHHHRRLPIPTESEIRGEI